MSEAKAKDIDVANSSIQALQAEVERQAHEINHLRFVRDGLVKSFAAMQATHIECTDEIAAQANIMRDLQRERDQQKVDIAALKSWQESIFNSKQFYGLKDKLGGFVCVSRDGSPILLDEITPYLQANHPDDTIVKLVLVEVPQPLGGEQS